MENWQSKSVFDYVVSKLDPINRSKCLRHYLSTHNKIRSKSRGSKKYIPIERTSNGQQYYKFDDQNVKIFPEELESDIKTILIANLMDNQKEIANFQLQTGIAVSDLFASFGIQRETSISSTPMSAPIADSDEFQKYLAKSETKPST
jgi:hypothetical protein